MPKRFEPIREDQRAALRKYADAVSPEYWKDDWKIMLNGDWMRAGTTRVDEEIYTLLHQLRNTHGPSWLHQYKLLRCDWEKECEDSVTRIDNKGFGYCEHHGTRIQSHKPCRKLRPYEKRRLERGELIKSY